MFLDIRRHVCIWWPLGLGDAQSASVAVVEYAGRQLLRRSLERGHRKIWQARDHECRSRVAVHRVRLDHQSDRSRHQDLDGWSRPISRQYLHRTVVAVPQTGSCLSARIAGRVPSQTGDQRLDRVLQRRAASHGTRQTITRRRILRDRTNPKSSMKLTRLHLS